MRNTSSDARISSAIASRIASRTVCFLKVVPSGTSSIAGASTLGMDASGAAAAGCAEGASSDFAGASDASSAALSSSPSSKSTAMGVFTFTSSVPSAIRILPITPSSTASNSIVALSVSISAMMSPEATVSPSLTSHLASVPSSMVGERAGMRILIAMCFVLTRKCLCRALRARVRGSRMRNLRLRRRFSSPLCR